MAKVAVVTGSNTGIGLAIVRGLCKQFAGDVYLTSRNVGRGEAAIAELQKEGLKPRLHQLDIEDSASIERLRSHLQDTYGGLDILVNNAGFAFKNKATEPFDVQASVSIGINYFGTLNVLKAMMPLLRPGARVVNLSSFVSAMTFAKCNPTVQNKMLAVKTVDDVSGLMNEFISLTKQGTHEQEGYPTSAYGMSKIGVCLLSPILQKELSADTSSKPDIIINDVDPGWVQTNMSSGTGTKTPDEGADSPIYAALLPPNTEHPKGEFISNRITKPWTQKAEKL